MKGTTIGTTVSAVGYALAIWGGWVLYQNSAPEQGIGRIPVVDSSQQPAGEFFRRQDEEIEERRKGSRFGFGLLTIGSSLQLIGTLIAGFSS